MDSLLSKINHPKELRTFEASQLNALAHEMREFILDTLSVKPGHLGASLGVIELTIALHYHYNTPNDLLIWDVGHQCYPHKILTGRQQIFDSLRQKDGISPKALEFAILTACRSGEIFGATWQEIDFKSKVWIIPKEQMKTDKEHRIPLSR